MAMDTRIRVLPLPIHHSLLFFFTAFGLVKVLDGSRPCNVVCRTGNEHEWPSCSPQNSVARPGVEILAGNSKSPFAGNQCTARMKEVLTQPLESIRRSGWELDRMRGGGGCISLLQPQNTKARLNQLLQKAAASGKTYKVEELLDLGADVNCMDESKQTPLLKAAEHGHCDTVELLVSRGATIELGDERNSYAMHYAAYNGHTHVVEALAGMGAGINMRNKFGYSPLQYASADGRLRTVRRLLELGADVAGCDNLRWTALHRAAGNGHARVVKALVESGADVNASDLHNYSALHEATWCGHVDTVRALVKLGADVCKTDAWGNTPIDLAMVQAQDGDDVVYRILTGDDDSLPKDFDLEEEDGAQEQSPWRTWLPCCFS